MSEQQFVRVDGVKWWIHANKFGHNVATPICPQHDMRVHPTRVRHYSSASINGRHSTYTTDDSRSLECSDGPHLIVLNRGYKDEQQFVLDKMESKIFAAHTFITLDDEAIPVGREKLKDSPYWVDAKVTKSKSGTRLIIWAGNREEKNKTQLFVETDLKRLSFDQNDTHPNEVFAIVEARFKDGSSAQIRNGDN